MTQASEKPEPQKYGFCHCCGKPMSEYDWWGSQGGHCVECFDHLVFVDEQIRDIDGMNVNGYYYCSLHDEIPPHLKTDVQKAIDSKAYKNKTLDDFFKKEGL